MVKALGLGEIDITLLLPSACCFILSRLQKSDFTLTKGDKDAIKDLMLTADNLHLHSPPTMALGKLITVK
jgi:hypothetical protein